MQNFSFEEQLDSALNENEDRFLEGLKEQLLATKSPSEKRSVKLLAANVLKAGCSYKLASVLLEVVPKPSYKNPQPSPLKQKGVDYLQNLIEWLEISFTLNTLVSEYIEKLARGIEVALADNEETAVKREARRLAETAELINWRKINAESTSLDVNKLKFYINYFYERVSVGVSTLWRSGFTFENPIYAHFLEEFPPFPAIIEKPEKYGISIKNINHYAHPKNNCDKHAQPSLNFTSLDTVDLDRWILFITMLLDEITCISYADPLAMIPRCAVFRYIQEQLGQIEGAFAEVACNFSELSPQYNLTHTVCRIAALRAYILRAAAEH